MNDTQILYISKSDFDWEYYLLKNPDIKKAGHTSLEKCYRHWISYGCYENRWVKSINNGVERQVKLRHGEKFPITPSPSVTPIHQPLVNLNFKIAIMIHVFDVKMMHFFACYVNYLNNSYNDIYFDVYINIVEENNPYVGDLKKYINEQLTTINNPNIHCYYNDNRGGDIGGFLLLSKIIVSSQIDYKYVIFVHSKNKSSWRQELCRCIFDIKFENLDKTPNIGIISAKKWVYPFDPSKQIEEYQRFKFHLIDLCSIYKLSCDHAWEFIAGTMFLVKMDIIRYIVAHDIDRVYSMLNRIDSVDINWVTIVDELRKDAKGTTNDYQYRLKYHHSLLSDYMIEHAYERIVGLICQHMGLKIVGQ